MPRKQKTGRPREHDRAALLKSLLAYIAATEIPIVTEWAYKQGIHRQQAYGMPELADALKLAVTKKEANLELFALAGKINTGMAIMSLKQIGWSDRRQVEHDATPQAAQTFAELAKRARAR